MNPKILIVDDDPALVETLKGLFELWKFDFIVAGDGSSAIAKAKKEIPDTILLDYNLPDTSGIEICKQLKRSPETKDVPIIMLTGQSGDENTVAALENGADDYIVKPFNPVVLNARIKSVLRIKKTMDEIIELSITDCLTGLYNRRYFEIISRDEFYRASRYNSPLSCIMLDVDKFKDINDNYGHEAGDYVLKQIGAVLSTVRKTDKACRWGGDEFIMLLPNTVGRDAITVADNLRRKVEEKDFSFNGEGISVAVSIGVSSLNEGPVKSTDDIIEFADKALYLAKNKGRNCVEYAT